MMIDMCTPIGHALAGAAIYKGGSIQLGHSSWMLFMILLCANLPDIDFIFGYIEGNPNLYHHAWTHSIAFCFVIGLLFTLIGWLFIGRKAVWLGFLAFGAVLSHLVMDFITVDQSAPFGIKLFWPVTEKYYISSVSIFQDVYKASSSNGFIESLFCRHNLITVLIEIVIVGPFFIWVCLLNRKGNRV